jgi:hypothetical protein
MEARRAFQKATQAPLDFTDSKQLLKQLQAPLPLSREKTP